MSVPNSPANDNPYAAPQAELNSESVAQQQGERWSIVDYCFHVGLWMSFAGLISMVAGWTMFSKANSTTIVVVTLSPPLAVLALGMIGAFAAGVNRLLQALGWRKRPISMASKQTLETEKHLA